MIFCRNSYTVKVSMVEWQCQNESNPETEENIPVMSPVNQCCSNWFEICYSQLQLLMAKTPITTHYNYTDSWTV